MCGIIGVIANQGAVDKALGGLKSLEYRGYDSAGIAFSNHEKLEVIKSVGNIDSLIKKVDNTLATATREISKFAIGHTRWATHGCVNEINAHPHLSNNGNFAVVHNGIIENYAQIREFLTNHGFHMKSETDTEVIPNLIQFYATQHNQEFVNTVKKAAQHLEGSYAILVTQANMPTTIVAARKGRQPLVIGTTQKQVFIASDILTTRIGAKILYPLEDGEIALINPEKLLFSKIDSDEIVSKSPIRKASKTIQHTKEPFSTYMEKEINQIPYVIRKILKKKKQISRACRTLYPRFKESTTIHMIGCGTAYHAGKMMGALLQKHVRLNTITYVASEFPSASPLLCRNDIGIVISQSGETADTLLALQHLKMHGIYTIGICNEMESSIARYVDTVLPIHAGTEKAVASTKAYVAQVLVSMILVDTLYKEKFGKTLIKACEFESLPNHAEEIITASPYVKMLATQNKDIGLIFILGKSEDYVSALEGALKIKEITYKPSFGLPSGELKHGTLSLVDNNTLTIMLNTHTDKQITSKINNAKNEVEARGSKIWDTTAFFPSNSIVSHAITTMPLQLFGLYLSQELGNNPDQPRNLAKSVTVE